MAIYPDGNPGVWPYDPNTEIGAGRVAIGDTTSTPYDPVEPGYQNYQYASDDQIAQWLVMADGNPYALRGFFYLDLAANAVASGGSTTYATDDLRYSADNSKGYGYWFALSQYWFGLAGTDEYFDIVTTGVAEYDSVEYWPYLDGPWSV